MPLRYEDQLSVTTKPSKVNRKRSPQEQVKHLTDLLESACRTIDSYDSRIMPTRVASWWLARMLMKHKAKLRKYGCDSD